MLMKWVIDRDPVVWSNLAQGSHPILDAASRTGPSRGNWFPRLPVLQKGGFCSERQSG